MTAALRIRGLSIGFPGAGEVVHDVSLDVARGEALGIVGETGSGKTLTGMTALGLLPRRATASGTVELDGAERSAGTAFDGRGKSIAVVFQNPGLAFNPVFTIGTQMTDVHRRHLRSTRREARARAAELLELVGLPEPQSVLGRYPHELSGGMLQRAMIALSLMCEPRFLVLDEPTTALDVTVAKQILELIDGLRRRLGLSVLLISHSLGVVHEVCDRVAVMYAGRIVEAGPTRDVLGAPRHPYTIDLLRAIPRRPDEGERTVPSDGRVGAPVVVARPGESFDPAHHGDVHWVAAREGAEP